MPDLTLPELATLTGLHPETLRRLARTGRLPGIYRIGGRWLMARAAADRLRQLPTTENEAGAAGGPASAEASGELVGAGGRGKA